MTTIGPSAFAMIFSRSSVPSQSGRHTSKRQDQKNHEPISCELSSNHRLKLPKSTCSAIVSPTPCESSSRHQPLQSALSPLSYLYHAWKLTVDISLGIFFLVMLETERSYLSHIKETQGSWDQLLNWERVA